ncbi:small acid-soluble spore protein Tlp [Siminovitchia acidinfaciens]|uniref:Small, acid-soluble spore protein Tlp n=1 Tax=Siminovitchia acidinfaciens TaxID=2321395 RepID=A0A429XWY9_9BACI|nr:small acid-soluble spore protein Tlp [Siminovitchia acidinfaciens]RST73012.1 small acid-soluble spore protein Tlp [Siminovitchia acidinfaciens]VEF48101.1 small, acid-soluble spore protein tlp [Bacillus freudenreichii]
MANNRPKPDDRSDNVEKLQEMVHNTIENMEKAEETMQFSNEEQKAQIEQKNERRRESIQGMREEIEDEAASQNNNYQ